MFKYLLACSLTGMVLIVLSGCGAIPVQTQLVYLPDTEMQRIEADCVSPGSGSAGFQPAGSHTLLNPQRISLLNWNAYKNQHDDWEPDFNRLAADQDIILLQEARLDEELYQSLSRKNLYWNLNAAFFYYGDEAGVLTASRVQAASSCGIRTIEPFIRIPKTILLTQFPLAGSIEKLLVANIHGINFTLGTEVYKNQIDAMSQAIKYHQGPIIVAGDFNSWSDDRMAIVNQMIDELSLQTVTYKNHNRIIVFGNAIDHVFYRGLELIEEKTSKVISSDHNPIHVVFKIDSQKMAKLSYE